MRNRSAASGNILFLILLAVILFAALSYAVTESLKGGGQEGMSKEAAKAAAAEILSWLGTVETAVQRMRVVKSIPDYQIDFKDPNNFRANGTPNNQDNASCASTNCEVFHPDGGGAISLNFGKYGAKQPNGWIETLPGMGQRDYMVAKMPAVSTPAGDVVIRVIAVKPEICSAYNQGLGLPKCPSIILSGTFAGFNGGFTAASLENPNATSYTGAEINTKATFCLCEQRYGIIIYTVVER